MIIDSFGNIFCLLNKWSQFDKDLNSEWIVHAARRSAPALKLESVDKHTLMYTEPSAEKLIHQKGLILEFSLSNVINFKARNAP